MEKLNIPLYSEEINNMAGFQKAWKLEGKEAENLYDWICKRRKVVDIHCWDVHQLVTSVHPMLFSDVQWVS